MIKLICDRCGKEIKGNICYTIKIKELDLLSSAYRSNYLFNESQSISSINSLANIPFENDIPHYCEDCKNKIEKVLKGGEPG